MYRSTGVSLISSLGRRGAVVVHAGLVEQVGAARTQDLEPAGFDVGGDGCEFDAEAGTVEQQALGARAGNADLPGVPGQAGDAHDPGGVKGDG